MDCNLPWIDIYHQTSEIITGNVNINVKKLTVLITYFELQFILNPIFIASCIP